MIGNDVNTDDYEQTLEYEGTESLHCTKSSMYVCCVCFIDCKYNLQNSYLIYKIQSRMKETISLVLNIKSSHERTKFGGLQYL